MRQDVFVVAYLEARSELSDINSKFEQLCQRKERLEGVVAALGPMLGKGTAEAESQPAAPAAGTAGLGEPAYTFNQVSPSQQDEERTTSDPFQQRLRNALKLNGHKREGLLNAM